MTKVRKMDYSFDEFLAGIAGMKAIDIAVYWVACSLVGSSGGPIPQDDERLFALIKEHPNAIRAAVQRLLAKGKLRGDEGGNMTNTRVELEVNNARTRIEQASNASRTRWGSLSNFKENQPLADASASGPAMPLPPSPSPSPSEGNTVAQPISNDGAEAPTSRARRKPPKPLPLDYAGSQRTTDHAKQLGYTADEYRALVREFVAYWTTGAGAGIKRADWDTTLCKRLSASHGRIAAHRRNGGGQAQGNGQARGSVTAAVGSIVARLGQTTHQEPEADSLDAGGAPDGDGRDQAHLTHDAEG